MKLTCIVFTIACISCNNLPDRKADKAAITKLLENESHFAAKGDSAQWASCWLNSDDISFMYVSAGGVQSIKGFKALARAIGEIEPFELKLKRNNYSFIAEPRICSSGVSTRFSKSFTGRLLSTS